MARASIDTLLPLATWAKLMGVNPFWFEQIGNVNNSTAQCEHVFFQYSWQQDFLSREEIANCISMAEQMVAEQLHYWPAPKYMTNEERLYPEKWDKNIRRTWPPNFGANSIGLLKSVKLNWHKVQGSGILARTAITAGVAVVLSDTDGDGIDDTFTLTTPTTITDVNEIGVYYTSAQRLGEPIDETWRIRPVSVAISGGNVVVTGRCYLIVKPNLLLGVNASELDALDATIYVTTLDIYRVFIDTEPSAGNQGFAIWEEDCGLPPCNVSYLPICVGTRNTEIGYVDLNWNLDLCRCPSDAPDRVRINYLAGEPLVNGNMAPGMANIVAHLATALLPGDKCGCDRVDRIIAFWRTVAPAAGEGFRENIAGDFSTNPFGPQRGAVWAWQRVAQIRQLV